METQELSAQDANHKTHEIVGLVIPLALWEELGLEPVVMLEILYETAQEVTSDFIVSYDEGTGDYVILTNYETEAEKIKRSLLVYLIGRVSGSFTEAKYAAIADFVYIQRRLSD
jgi:hypothetical protein